MKKGLFIIFLIFLIFFVYSSYDFVKYTIASGWAVTYYGVTNFQAIFRILSVFIFLIIPLLLLVIFTYLFWRGKSNAGNIAKTSIIISIISIALLIIFRLIPRTTWIHLSSKIKYGYLFFTSTNYTNIPYINYLFYSLILLSSILIIIGYVKGKQNSNNFQYANNTG